MTPTRRDVLAGTIGTLATAPAATAFAAGPARIVDLADACRETEAAWRRLLAIEDRMTAAGLTFVRAEEYRAYDHHLRGLHRSGVFMERRSRAMTKMQPPKSDESWTRLHRESRKWTFAAIRRNAALRERFGVLSAEWGLDAARAAVRAAVDRERGLAAAEARAFTWFDPPLAERSTAIPSMLVGGDDEYAIWGPLFAEDEAIARWGALTPDEFGAATYVRRMEELGFRFNNLYEAHALTHAALADKDGDAARLVMRAARTPGISAAIETFLHDREDRYHASAERWPYPGSEWRVVRTMARQAKLPLPGLPA